MPKGAKFNYSLSRIIDASGGTPLVLYLFISLGKNRNGENLQSGDNLKAYIQLVNRNRCLQTQIRGHIREAISKVKVVVSGDLFSQYVGLEEARKEEENWIQNNIEILRILDSQFGFNPSEDIISWQQVKTECPLYGRALTDIENLYLKDEKFKGIVDGLVSEHKHRYRIPKGTETEKEYEGVVERATRNYLFKESAVFLSWGKAVCYPSARFNDATDYVLGKLKGQGSPPYPGSSYIGYSFITGLSQDPAEDCSAGTSGSQSPRSRKNSSPPRVSAAMPFFRGKVNPNFPYKMVVEKQNHVWAAQCEILFRDLTDAEGAASLLIANIQSAKEHYDREKAKTQYPVVFKNAQEFPNFTLSYTVTISAVLGSVNPFDVLIRDVHQYYKDQAVGVPVPTSSATPLANSF